MSSSHIRVTGPMMSSPRCGAKTRSGAPCKSPAVSGRNRCRMHGGAPGSGAPAGNTNALKGGLYTQAHDPRAKTSEAADTGCRTVSGRPREGIGLGTLAANFQSSRGQQLFEAPAYTSAPSVTRHLPMSQRIITKLSMFLVKACGPDHARPVPSSAALLAPRHSPRQRSLPPSPVLGGWPLMRRLIS